ncbi:MAG: ABC transporter permease, partial [Promethearchaeota archaeon]
MRTWQIIFKHFKRKRLHVVLLVLGIVSAVATSYLFSALKTYYRKSINDLFPSRDDILVVTERGVPYFQIVPFGSRLNESLVAEINKLSGVHDAYGCLYLRVADVENTSLLSGTIFGLNISSLGSNIGYLSKSLLIQGRFPRAGMDEVVVGINVGGGKLEINDTFLIGGKNFSVVGILSPSSFVMDHVLLCDLGVVQSLFHYQGIITCIIVDVSVLSSPSAVQEKIISRYPSVQAVNSNEVGKLSGYLLVLRIADLIFGVVVSSSSILFMYLVLLKKFQESSREIWLMHVLGTPTWKIFLIHVIELLFLSVIGYMLGISLGFFILFEMNAFKVSSMNTIASMLNLTLN